MQTTIDRIVFLRICEDRGIEPLNRLQGLVNGTGIYARMTQAFRAAGYDDSNFRFVLDPEAEHTEAAWEKRLPSALTFLFGDWKPTPPPLP